jgi:hypothetical protein
MLAGILAANGYFSGSDLLEPTPGNPKGYFEDREVNRINEELLAQVVPRRPRLLGRWFFKDRPMRNQRWLARLSTGTKMTPEQDHEQAMRRCINRRPFCLKDPRFSYTLPAWGQVLQSAVRICVFRHPGATMTSILKEIAREPYLRSMRMSQRQVLAHWVAVYASIRALSETGEWLFVHYEQVLDATASTSLCEVLDAPELHFDFVDRSLKRSRPAPVSRSAEEMYLWLCERSDYDDRSE